MWVSGTMFFPPPKDDVVRALLRGIKGLCDGGGSGWGTFKEPSLKPVKAEWAGHRSRLSDVGTRESAVEESEKFCELLKAATSNVTMLYVHGCGF